MPNGSTHGLRVTCEPGTTRRGPLVPSRPLGFRAHQL